MLRTVLKFVLPLLAVALGVGFAVRMVKTRPKAKRAKVRKEVMLVDARPLRAVARAVIVEATGSVVPERTIALQPEVAGVIRKEAEGFEVGKRFVAGDEVVRLDDRDLRLAIKQRKAAITTAKFELTMEKGRAQVAREEWKLLGGKVPTTAIGKSIALRKPQKEAAQARIAQAEAALQQAKVNLGRTTVKAPFDCVVRDKRASLGQLVSPGAPIATLVGTERFFVNVSVPVARLSALAVPGLNAKVGSVARVHQETGAGQDVVRKGRVVRMLSDLDPNGRMARLVVAVDKPLDPPAGVDPDRDPWLPLLIGAYVRVELEGRKLEGVLPVPRLALREGDRVWVAKDGKLDIRDVRIVWREKDTVLVDQGLSDGERIITSRIPTPTPGMAVRVRGDAAPPARAAGPGRKPAPQQGAQGQGGAQESPDEAQAAEAGR